MWWPQRSRKESSLAAAAGPLPGPAGRRDNSTPLLQQRPTRQQQKNAGLDPQVIAISVMALVMMVGASVIAPILPLFAQELGVSYAGAGALISAFAIGRIPFDFVGGSLADRLSPRWMATLGASLVALSALLSGLAESFSALVWYRALDGVGSALFVITAMAFLIRTVAPHNMGKAMSFYQSMILLGVSVGPAIGGASAQLFASLRAPFFVMALFSFCVACFSFLWIEDLPPQASPEKKRASSAEQPTSSWPLLFSLVRDQTFLFACVLTMLVFAIRAGVRLNLVPLLAKDVVGLNEAWIGTLLSVAALANFAVLWHAGSLLDRAGRRRVTMPSLWGALFVVLSFIWAKTFFLLFLTMASLGVVMGYLAPAPAAMVADLTPPAVAGSAMGFYRMAGDLGLLLGPVSFGWVAARFGFTPAFVCAGACVALVLLMGIGTRETLTGEKSGGKVAGQKPAI